MKVGEYIRTEDGIIDKVIIEYNGKCASQTCNCKHVSCEKNYYDEDKIIKSSPNIIDLIEVGDYVNGNKIEIIDKPCKLNPYGSLKYRANDCYDFEQILGNEIISIVTKEAFESMEYRIGE